MEFVFWVESQHLKEQLFHARKYSGFWSLNSSVGSKSLVIIGDSQANYKLKEPTWGASKLCWPQVCAISVTRAVASANGKILPGAR